MHILRRIGCDVIPDSKRSGPTAIRRKRAIKARSTAGNFQKKGKDAGQPRATGNRAASPGCGAEQSGALRCLDRALQSAIPSPCRYFRREANSPIDVCLWTMTDRLQSLTETFTVVLVIFSATGISKNGRFHALLPLVSRRLPLLRVESGFDRRRHSGHSDVCSDRCGTTSAPGTAHCGGDLTDRDRASTDLARCLRCTDGLYRRSRLPPLSS